MERLASLCTSEPVVWGDLQSEPASRAERVCWGECRAFSLLAEHTHSAHTDTHIQLDYLGEKNGSEKCVLRILQRLYKMGSSEL